MTPTNTCLRSTQRCTTKTKFFAHFGSNKQYDIVADFLNIPPPSHPPDASPTLEHRPLPPQWQPPIPPTSASSSCMEESQYDEAQPPEPAVRASKQAAVLPGALIAANCRWCRRMLNVNLLSLCRFLPQDADVTPNRKRLRSVRVANAARFGRRYSPRLGRMSRIAAARESRDRQFLRAHRLRSVLSSFSRSLI